jgi:2-methylisocitrate lyase-like PEP mutase family enzyme
MLFRQQSIVGVISPKIEQRFVDKRRSSHGSRLVDSKENVAKVEAARAAAGDTGS